MNERSDQEDNRLAIQTDASSFTSKESTAISGRSVTMDRMLVVLFNSEREAYEGTRILKDLHAEGAITLYGEAVVVKDASGKVTVKEAADAGPLGTAVGLLTGSLVGLIGGPAGVAVGAAAGMYSGSMFDLARAGVSAGFFDDVSRSLEPGKAAVVAEIQEEWIIPLDSRMEAAGGTVLRRARADVVDAEIERDVAAIDADIAAMQAEYTQATGEAKTKLQAKIDAARAEHQRIQDRGRASAEAAQRHAEAKLAALKEQAAAAHAERKQQIAKREAEVRAEYENRAARLNRAA
jgi:uncharacterized membrane protein